MVRAKSTRPAPVKKKAVAKPVRRTTQRKAKKKPQREMPSWLRYVIAGIIAFLFLAAFFYFFIRPYSYRWKPCYGFKAYGVCMPSGFHVHGIDVSHYQGNIDWKMLTQTRQGKFPIHFVFMNSATLSVKRTGKDWRLIMKKAYSINLTYWMPQTNLYVSTWILPMSCKKMPHPCYGYTTECFVHAS